MSQDVQMFVFCDHVLNVPKINDPVIKPELSLEYDPDSTLQAGTYYVGYTYLNKHNVETILSPIAKIYVSLQQNLIVDIDEYIDPGEILTYNVYVTYTPENLVSTDLSKLQATKEANLIKTLFYQDNVKEELLYLSDFNPKGATPPEKNLTRVASYIGREGMCPKCNGKNYYYDIYFDKNGLAVTTTGSQKLMQECLKVLIDEKLGNQFHPGWGCDVEQKVGTKNLGKISQFMVELSVRNAIEYLQGLQRSNQLLFQNMKNEEMISAIESITVEKNGPTGYNVRVEISTMVGDLVTYNVNL